MATAEAAEHLYFPLEIKPDGFIRHGRLIYDQDLNTMTGKVIDGSTAHAAADDDLTVTDSLNQTGMAVRAGFVPLTLPVAVMSELVGDYLPVFDLLLVDVVPEETFTSAQMVRDGGFIISRYGYFHAFSPFFEICSFDF